MARSSWLAHLTVGRHLLRLWDDHPDQVYLYEVQPEKPSLVASPPPTTVHLRAPTEPGTRYRMWARDSVEDPWRGMHGVYFTQGFVRVPEAEVGSTVLVSS